MIPVELVAALQTGPLDTALVPLYWLLALWSSPLFAVDDATGPGFLDYRSMHHAILVSLCVGVMTSLIRTFLVRRQLALIGDTLVHIAFTGVTVDLFLNGVFSPGVSPYLVAVVVAVIAALLIELISEATDAYSGMSIVIVLLTGFALGVVLISLNTGGLAVGIDQCLFSNLSTVSAENAAILLVLFAVIVGTAAFAHNQLLCVTFDETAAAIPGISVTWYNRVMVMPTALVAIGATRTTGVILVAAVLVILVTDAAQVFRSFSESLLASVMPAELAVLLGIGASYYGETTAGGVIILVAVGIYIVAVTIGKVQARAGADATPGLRDIDSCET